MKWSSDNYCTVVCAGIILFVSVLIKTSGNWMRQNENFEARKLDINRLASAMYNTICEFGPIRGICTHVRYSDYQYLTNPLIASPLSHQRHIIKRKYRKAITNLCIYRENFCKDRNRN